MDLVEDETLGAVRPLLGVPDEIRVIIDVTPLGGDCHPASVKNKIKNQMSE